MIKTFVTLKLVSLSQSLLAWLPTRDVPGSERSVQRILDVNNIEPTDVLLTVYNHTSPTHVTAACDHNGIASIELDKIGDLVLLEVELDGVVDLDGRIGVANRSPVVRDDVWNALGSQGHFSDLQKLVTRFLGRDAMDSKATLNVVKKSEMFA